MPRAAPPPLIPAKVFRHFAVLTIAITLTVAVFANGDNAEAIEGQVQARVEKTRLQTEQAKLSGPERLGAMHLSPEFTAGDADGPDADQASDGGGIGQLTADALMGGEGQYEGSDLPVPQRCRGLASSGVDALTGRPCGSAAQTASSPRPVLTAPERGALFEASRLRSGEAAEPD